MSIIIAAIVLLAMLSAVVATVVAIASPRLRIVASLLAVTGLAISGGAVAVFMLAVSRMG